MRSFQSVFVMIKCELGRAYDVAAKMIDTIEETAEVFSISGQYDLIAKFHLDPQADVGHFVTSRVQTVSGVRDTFTMIAFNAFS
jgi:DNA-binding Lrp family transcriptional regulator